MQTVAAAIMLLLLCPLLLARSRAARAVITLTAISGFMMALHHGDLSLHDGTLHSATAKVIAVLLMGTAALWHVPANDWFSRKRVAIY